MTPPESGQTLSSRRPRPGVFVGSLGSVRTSLMTSLNVAEETGVSNAGEVERSSFPQAIGGSEIDTRE